jgi:hypothetical protein
VSGADLVTIATGAALGALVLWWFFPRRPGGGRG